jgi:hypothetical protein
LELSDATKGESNEGKDIASCGCLLAGAAHRRVLCKPDASGGASRAAGRPRTTRCHRPTRRLWAAG